MGILGRVADRFFPSRSSTKGRDVLSLASTNMVDSSSFCSRNESAAPSRHQLEQGGIDDFEESTMSNDDTTSAFESMILLHLSMCSSSSFSSRDEEGRGPGGKQLNKERVSLQVRDESDQSQITMEPGVEVEWIAPERSLDDSCHPLTVDTGFGIQPQQSFKITIADEEVVKNETYCGAQLLQQGPPSPHVHFLEPPLVPSEEATTTTTEIHYFFKNEIAGPPLVRSFHRTGSLLHHNLRMKNIRARRNRRRT